MGDNVLIPSDKLKDMQTKLTKQQALLERMVEAMQIGSKFIEIIASHERENGSICLGYLDGEIVDKIYKASLLGNNSRYAKSIMDAALEEYQKYKD